MGLVLTSPSVTQQAYQIVVEADTSITAQIQVINGHTIALYNSIFNNQSVTPQSVLTAFGTSAGLVINYLQTGFAFVNAVAPGTITTTLPALTVNEDGSVTVQNNVSGQTVQTVSLSSKNPVVV